MGSMTGVKSFIFLSINKQQMASNNPDEPEARFFTCIICGLKERYHSYGSAPFLKNLRFSEDVYAMKDPFQPRGSKSPMNVLVLGSNCGRCGNSVCIDATCSIFYRKRFCRNCAVEKVNRFPGEMQKEIEKMEVANKNPDRRNL